MKTVVPLVLLAVLFVALAICDEEVGKPVACVILRFIFLAFFFFFFLFCLWFSYFFLFFL